MSLSITRASGHNLHSYNSMRLHGVPALSGFGFNLTLEGTKEKIDEGDLIYLEDFVLHLSLPNGHFVASAFPQQYPRADLSPYDSTSLHFFFEITGSSIEMIESYRSGRDSIEFLAKFGCIVHEPQEEHIRDQYRTCAQTEKFSIPSQQWLQALEQAGYRRSLFFELGLPDIKDDKYKTVKSLISEAQSHLANGSYRSAVSTCRSILDSLEYKSSAEKPSLNTLVNKFKIDKKSMSVAERLQFCKEAIKHAGHLGAHADHDEEFSRSQAHAIFGMVVSIACCTGLDWIMEPEELES